MPRSRRSGKRPYSAEHVPLDMDRVGGIRRAESGPDGEWTTQRVGGSDRTFRCPGCDQLIATGTPHVVAWRADSILGDGAALDNRRHWHTSCWQARLRRRPSR